jgi:alkaline phosphatase D
VTSDSISRWGVDVLARATTGTTPARLRLTGLRSNTRYYYRPVTDRDAGPEGSFVTLPASEDYRDPATPRDLFNFRFQFGSCANQKPGSGTGPALPAYGTMLRTIADKVRFSIMNGDWLYDDKREFTVDEWNAQVILRDRPLPQILQLAPSIRRNADSVDAG